MSHLTGFGVHAARIRVVRLTAIERPGLVQVYAFRVETSEPSPTAGAKGAPVLLLGVSRDDGRKSRIEVLLTADPAAYANRLAQWSEGLITRR